MEVDPEVEATSDWTNIAVPLWEDEATQEERRESVEWRDWKALQDASLSRRYVTGEYEVGGFKKERLTPRPLNSWGHTADRYGAMMEITLQKKRPLQ